METNLRLCVWELPGEIHCCVALSLNDFGKAGMSGLTPGAREHVLQLLCFREDILLGTSQFAFVLSCLGHVAFDCVFGDVQVFVNVCDS